MKHGDYEAKVLLHFPSLSTDQLHTLETYMRDGMEGKDWDTPIMTIEARLIGWKDVDKETQKVNQKRLLEMEKEAK